MQLFINNWSSALALPATASAVQLSVPPADAARLVGLGAGDHYLLTLAIRDINGIETAWEIVRVTAQTAGVLDVLRAQEGTEALELGAGTLIVARLTQQSMETLRDSGGPALSDAVPAALGSAAPGVSPDASRQDHVHELPTPADIGAATAAQGAVADSAVQPGDLAAVATSGDYDDLTGKPTIPEVAADVGAIALTEKGAASGVATLDVGGKVPIAQLPALAITESFVVASEAAMLALTAQTGDVAIRTDISTSFILQAEPASTLGNWQEILAPAAGGGAPVGSATPQPLGTASPGVSTSASRQDHVHEMPTPTDLGLGNVDNTSDLNKPVSTAQQEALDDKVDKVPGKGLSTEDYSSAEKTKLGGIAANANNYSHPNHSGDVTSAGDGVQTIANNAVSNAKAADMAVNTIKGRITAGTGDPEDLSPAQVRSILNVADRATGLPVIQTITSSRSLVLADINTFNVNSTTNNYTVTIQPQASVTWTADAEIHFLPSSTGDIVITGGAGVSVNGVSAGSVTLSTAYGAASIKRISADSWWVGGAIGGSREVLTANRTYYVRTDGSDSNNGLTDTAGGAFLTIQRAVDAAASIDSGIYQTTIKIADGTYTGVVVVGALIGANPLIILGNATTPSNVHLNVTGVAVTTIAAEARIVVTGVKITATAVGLNASPAGVIEFYNIVFGAIGSRHIGAQFNGFVGAIGSYSIEGGSSQHALATQGGKIRLGLSGATTTITLTGTPNFTVAFVVAGQGPSLITLAASPPTFSGSATGKRYDVKLNSVIDTSGAGDTFFPGNAAGTTATGGQYA